MLDLPATRAAALEAGSPRYFNGKPCPAGHLAERDTIDGGCMTCRAQWRRQGKQRARAKLKAAQR